MGKYFSPGALPIHRDKQRQKAKIRSQRKKRATDFGDFHGLLFATEDTEIAEKKGTANKCK